MSVRIAINGFGRIGRLAFRQMFGTELFDIVAINDLTSPRMLAHLLKYDSTQGTYSLADKVTHNDSAILIDGHTIPIYAESDACKLPWRELGVDVVLECTGFYTSREKASSHLKAGAKKVVISAPAGDDIPTIVYNVNHKILKPTDRIVSAASCTTNCLAPMAKALNDCHPIISGLMCTIHGYTGDQMTLDGPQRKGDLRRSRAAAVNIVPNSTGSTTLLHAVIEGQTSVDELNAAIKSQTNESFGYNTDEIVSSDIVGMRYGSLFDATQTMVMNLEHHMAHVQVVSWYDNENSYTSQMVRTIAYLAQL